RGTWIISELVDGYRRLHALGFAHSIEAWNGDRLVGGLYGVGLGRMFFGESMFALEADASKIAFAMLLAQLTAWKFALVDCQVHTEHLERFGAEEWPRVQFLETLRASVGVDTRRGPWQLELNTEQALQLIAP
ncbi:MAG: leucyl/phenylalanyl-tRNA--protein transferase, partial [Myxococcaceae bacterium]|nr:leucyl/phenylalanyl-tRNA--protein transferase [Myxococcaceae bacterium]